MTDRARARARARARKTIPVLLVIAISGARADAPKLAAVAADPANVGAAILVGPAGQVYGPVPDGGGWARTSAGGIAGGAAAAVRDGGDVIAAGGQTPLYRWHDGAWVATPLAAKGSLVLGVGPAAAAAVGTAVFVRGAKAWTRIADAPAAPTALWAASETQVWIVAGGVAWRLRGKSFVRAGAANALAAGARGPLAIAGDAAIDTATNRAYRAAGEIVAAAGAGTDVWLLVRGAHGAMIERHTAREGTTPLAPVAVPGTATWTWLWADTHGRIAVAAPTGEVEILDGGAWRSATVDAALPAPHAGPGPAISR